MNVSRRTVVMAIVALAVTSGCVSDGQTASDPDTTEAGPPVSVTVPPERLTPFCETMIDLSDQLRTEEVDDGEALIIETYRSIQPEVPPEISADFDIVLNALERGEPVPTDPPLPTTPSTTTPPFSTTTTSTTTSTTTVPGSSVPASSAAPTTKPAVDVGYAAGHSPSERINNYVTLACRSTQNNPGPQATQPLGEPPTTDE